MITHKWGDNAQSPCGLPVAMVYSTNDDMRFASEWKEVDCPTCLQAFVDQQKAAAERRARAAEEPSYIAFARAAVRDGYNTGPMVVKALLERIDAQDRELANCRTSDGNAASPTVHERWLDIDWDDNGGIRGYKAEHCNCTTPWRHRP